MDRDSIPYPFYKKTMDKVKIVITELGEQRIKNIKDAKFHTFEAVCGKSQLVDSKIAEYLVNNKLAVACELPKKNKAKK